MMAILSIVSDHFLEILVTVGVIVWFSRRNKSKLNLPPGPKGVPILGYIPYVNSQTIHQDLIEMSDKYKSKIIFMRLGMDNVVFLNDYETIKDVLSRDDMQDRPNHQILAPGQLATWSGNLWRNQRSFTLRSLRNLGFGKSKFEGKIHEEVKYMTDKIDEADGKPIRILSFLGPSISNTIGLMTTGQRYDYEDEIRKNIDSLFIGDKTDIGFTNFSVFCYFPVVMTLISKIPSEIGRKMTFFFTFLQNYLHNLISDRGKAIEKMSDFEIDQESDNFIDVYLKKVKSVKSQKETEDNKFFTNENLFGCLISIFGAGSSTTKDLIEWFLALMAIHQDVQEEMYQEIKRVIGSSKSVSLDDKNDLPITESIIYETLRYGSLIPINLPHAASKETKINAYDIPKGTIIFANTYAVHMDPDLWKNPELFKYDRFLSADRTKFVKDEHMIAFGYGRRVCPGESMAILEMLIFGVTLIQKYHVAGEEALKLNPRINSIARVAHPELKLKFTPRQEF